jgi:hypothetical protein
MLYQIVGESGSVASMEPSAVPPGCVITSTVCTAFATGGSLTLIRSIIRYPSQSLLVTSRPVGNTLASSSASYTVYVIFR